MQQKVINDRLSKIVPKLAKDEGLADNQIINFYELMGGDSLSKPELFPDGSHCNDTGYTFIGK